MFIEIISKEGELSWINLKQVLVIKLGRPTEGWLWDSLTGMFFQALDSDKSQESFLSLSFMSSFMPNSSSCFISTSEGASVSGHCPF